ncbi:MAG: PAS domain S-box protein [Actinobacteria bacterium]|nr:PAS domain S-box protein [Actinomycetota bacterium]
MDTSPAIDPGTKGASSIRVLVVGDALERRGSLVEVLATLPGIQVVGLVTDAGGAVEAVRTLAPHVVVIDLGMPGMEGLEATRRIVARDPEVPVLVSSADGDESLVIEALLSGARGCLPQRPASRAIADAIRAAAQRDASFPSEIGGPLFDRLIESLRRERAMRSAAEEASADRESQHRLAKETSDMAEARFRTLVEQIPAITYTEAVDTQDTLFISPQVKTLLGYTAREWLEDPHLWEQLMHPDDVERVVQECATSNREQRPFRSEYRVIARDGRLFWFMDDARLVLDENGTPLCWQGVMNDITEQKMMEEERQRLLAVVESERRLREMLENVQLAAVGLDLAGDITFCNDYLLGLSGRPGEEVLGRNWFETFVPQELRDVRDGFLPDPTAGSILAHHESPILTGSEDRRVISWSNTVVRDAHGRVVGATCIGQDITEQREAEQRLKEAETKYRTLIEQIPAATYVDVAGGAYPDVRPLYVSPQIESMLGVTPQEFVGDDLWEALLHPDDRATALQETVRGVASREPFSIEYRMVSREGRTLWIRDQATVLRDQDGLPTAVHGVLFDITDLKRAEEELRIALEIEQEASERLRQADEMKTAFLTAVSHELRTPLSAVLAAALTLEQREHALDAEPEVRREILRGLARSAGRLSELLTDILDVDRLARGVVEPRRSLTDLGELVRRIVEGSDLLRDRVVHLEVDAAVAAVDRPMVERIVENLLANVARHTPPEAQAWVRVVREGEGVVVVVEDDGPGVPADLREIVFEPFRQGENVPSHSPGVGLGLSLVARFAQLHAGRAWVEERPGGGASFRVFFPEATNTNDLFDEMVGSFQV